MKNPVDYTIKVRDKRTADGGTVLDLANGVKVIYPSTFCQGAILHYSEEIADLFQTCGYLPLPKSFSL